MLSKSGRSRPNLEVALDRTRPDFPVVVYSWPILSGRSAGIDQSRPTCWAVIRLYLAGLGIDVDHAWSKSIRFGPMLSNFVRCRPKSAYVDQIRTELDPDLDRTRLADFDQVRADFGRLM